MSQSRPLPVCPVCRKPFEPTRSDQIYCSSAHRKKAFRLRAAEAAEEAGLVRMTTEPRSTEGSSDEAYDHWSPHIWHGLWERRPW
jgi:hypothetical protein